ncbi:cation:proton antiporter [Amycolatopsis sp. CA-230715]|uniref:cation:proton antiporter n=1 Tax=Amycolatopsis sp. CA-230715 TaxID=2745196 RepID=UPI001C0270E3|nr:cation:proton antiporter [Amycolatopsis sp. CA-230715]QWF85977.1 hypothetical protein HUW46_09458 [Amycolatopsis sp. CA-230715]
MTAAEIALRAGHSALALGALAVLVLVARLLARLLRQPAVIFEIATGIVVGPVLMAIGGRHLVDAVLPAGVLDWVRLVGHVGLVLFVVGVAHEIRVKPAQLRGRLVGWTTAGGILVPLAAGALLATWVLLRGGPAVRGDAPAPAVALLVAVALSVTAVPVLARILADDGLSDTPIGRLVVVVAVFIDAASWLLVAVAIGLGTGGFGGTARLLAVLAAGVLAAAALRRFLSTARAGAWCARFPRGAALALAGTGLAASAVLRHWGLTEIFGAVLVGFALPAGSGAWRGPVLIVTRAGRTLVPLFFVVTGVTVFADVTSAVPWTAIGLATVLAGAGKLGGGYLGARFGGLPPGAALRAGALLNARGLTELAVLQAGYQAHILTPSLYFALVVMALVTTASASPAHRLIERITRRAAAEPVPEVARP